MLPYPSHGEADADVTPRPRLIPHVKGKRLRDQFWHDLVTDAGPLTPLRESDLRTLTRLLAKLGQPAE